MPPHAKPISAWLLTCCALIFVMVVLGGVTRLTRSGLSIVEWNPIIGALPPLGEQHWQAAFAKYRQTPEFKLVNSDITLAQFKSIYWIEYAHRLLGRAIGLVFLLPLIYFLYRRWIRGRLAPKLVAVFLLGALQGALGWFMVQSGLIDNPQVSPYRLSAHLGLAVIIYGLILWMALDLLYPQPGSRARPMGFAVTGLIFVMILSGGFVAGTRAGFAFNTFPLMNGQLIPAGLFALTPGWRNFFENIATVQFSHRLLAGLLCIVVLFFWFRARRASSPRTRHAANALLLFLVVQVTLGLLTLLYVVPIPLAAAHQAGALLLFTSALILTHAWRRSDQENAKDVYRTGATW